MIDGVANVVLNYAKILGERGHDVIVGTPRYPGADYDAYPYKVVPYQSFDTTALSGGYRAGSPFAVDALYTLRDFGPEIIHAHSPMSAMYMARSLRNLTDAPIIYTYHTKYDIDIARAIRGELVQKEAIRAIVTNITAADRVYAVSKGAADNLHELGFEGECGILDNGVDFPKGVAEEKFVRQTTSAFDLPAGIPVFLFVGRLMNYKGLPVIFDALCALSDVGEDFRMVFIGSGADGDELEKNALEKGFAVDRFVPEEEGAGRIVQRGKDAKRPGKIIFTGPVRDREILRAWNTRADLFLFPSTFDTNGLVVREAAACGLASVLIRDSCAAENVADGRDGFLIEKNAASLAAMLVKLSSQPGKMKTVGQNAMDDLYLSWSDAVVRAERIYQEILAEKAGGTLPARKKAASDYFFELAAQVAESTENVFTRQREAREGMMENASALMDKVRSWLE